MNRIDEKLAELKKNGEKALISFITAGDPDFAVTEKLVAAMEQAGADLIELGVPFSDPTAEGPAIQEANLRSMKSGTTLAKILELAGKVRPKVKAPLLLVLYVNMIFHYGYERFFDACRQQGIDGIVVPDIPYEELDEIESFADKADVYCIRSVAPTSRDRIEMISKDAKGFLYCNFSTVPFSRAENILKNMPESIRIPMAADLGIMVPEQISNIKDYCDGVIINNAFVEKAAIFGESCEPQIAELVRKMKNALK